MILEVFSNLNDSMILFAEVMDGSAELLSHVASVRGVRASLDLLSIRGWSISALLNFRCVNCCCLVHMKARS